MTIQLAERSVQVEALPVGIHYNQFNELAVSVPALINVSDNVKVVLAIDRLDYTKGTDFVGLLSIFTYSLGEIIYGKLTLNDFCWYVRFL